MPSGGRYWRLKYRFGGKEKRLAIRLLMLTFVRTRELIEAKWDKIDLDALEWSIPAARMKMKSPHLVPLSRQSVDILRQLQTMNGSRG